MRCHHAGVRLTWQRCSLVICRNGDYAAAMVDGAHQFHGSSACRSWFLVMFERHGYGERLITWFKATGHADRQALVYAAFLAYVRGPSMLLDFNPEARQPASISSLRSPAAARSRHRRRRSSNAAAHEN